MFPFPPSRKFNVQCITPSSIFACVATLCILSITYSSSPFLATRKPSGLFNNSCANAWIVLIHCVFNTPPLNTSLTQTNCKFVYHSNFDSTHISHQNKYSLLHLYSNYFHCHRDKYHPTYQYEIYQNVL